MTGEENHEKFKYQPEWLKRSWKPSEKSGSFWKMPDISDVETKTGESIRIIMDVDKNRIKVLRTVGDLVEKLANVLNNISSDINIEKLQKASNKQNVLSELKDAIRKNSVIDKAKKSFEEFKAIPIIINLLSPPIYARIEFVFKELINKLQEANLILAKNKLEESDFKKLKSIFDFQTVVSDVSATINSFANQLASFGAPLIDLKELLDDALKIPGYPLKTIRAVHTLKNELDELPYYYEYYQNSMFAPQEIKNREETLLKNKEATIDGLEASRRENIKNIFNHIKAKQIFTDIIKGVLNKSGELQYKVDEDLDLNSDHLIEQIMQTRVFENPRVLEFLIEENVLEDESVTDSLGEIVKLQNEIIFWRQKSTKKLFEDKLRNENFNKLQERSVQFDYMKELYEKWKEVADIVKSK